MKTTYVPVRDEWIKQLWYIYTMEYYSAMIKKGILPFLTTCMDLEDFMLSVISQTEKDKYYIKTVRWWLSGAGD